MSRAKAGVLLAHEFTRGYSRVGFPSPSRLGSAVARDSTIPPRLLVDLLGGMLVLGGQDHTPALLWAVSYHTIPRKKLEP